MNRKKNHSPCHPPLTALIVMLFALSFSLPCAHASAPWVEVHPPVIKEALRGIRLIHFIDANTGWAVAQGFLGDDPVWGGVGPDILLRTSDGGQNWRQHESNDDALLRPKHFVSPTMGWRLTPLRGDNFPGLRDDLEFFQTTDGGLTWQLRRGKVAEVILTGERVPIRLIEQEIRIHDYAIYFLDNQFGWILGITSSWIWKWNEIGFPAGAPLAGNFLCSTRDGGDSWKCQIHIYLSHQVGESTMDMDFRAPADIDFVSPQVGWIASLNEWMYHTTDGGITWDLVGNPIQEIRLVNHPKRYVTHIDFLDESHGWAVARNDGGSGVWFTLDAGRTWKPKFPGPGDVVYADINGVWISGSMRSATGEIMEGIFHSKDYGETWTLEWEGPQSISYIGYHEVTQTLWAGGLDGVILKRTIPTTPVTSKGKLATLWGETQSRSEYQSLRRKPMIRIKNNRLAATLAILIAFGIALPGAHASNLWVEMQPPVIENARSAMELIHFLDANTGWIETRRFSKDPFWDWLGEDEYIIMRTINGGESWRRANPPAIFHEYLGYERKRTHFVSPTIGWKLGDDPPRGGGREAWDNRTHVNGRP